MDWTDALDALGGHPHAAHFRRLCRDDSDPGRRDAWRARVIAMAAGGEPAATQVATPPRPDVAEALAHVRAMKACPFRAVGPGCGCGGARCALRSGAVVSHLDCLACLNRYDAWML